MRAGAQPAGLGRHQGGWVVAHRQPADAMIAAIEAWRRGNRH